MSQETFLQLSKRGVAHIRPDNFVWFLLPCQDGKRCCNICKVRGKPSTISQETKESLYIFLCLWLQILCHSFKLLWVGSNCPIDNNMTQVAYLPSTKLTILTLESQISLLQLFKYRTHMAQVFFPGLAVDNYIIYVTTSKLLTIS